VLDSGVVGMPDRALHRSENWRLSILYMHTKNTKHTQQTEQQQKGGGGGGHGCVCLVAILDGRIFFVKGL